MCTRVRMKEDCYVTVSVVLLPLMHNECLRHALSIEFEYKLMRVSLTWLPPSPNSICAVEFRAIGLAAPWVKAMQMNQGRC